MKKREKILKYDILSKGSPIEAEGGYKIGLCLSEMINALFALLELLREKV